MNTFNIVIVHGTEGYPQKNWYPDVADALTAQGHNVIRPQFSTFVPPEGVALNYPDGKAPENLKSYVHQVLPVWLSELDEAMKQCDPTKPTILVGHSLGGLTVLRYAETRTNNPLHAVVAVAPVGGPISFPEYFPMIETFYKDIKGDDIRKGADKIVFFVGSNDDIVPPEQSKALATLCKADKVVEVENGGHFWWGNGYYTFPLLVDELNKIMYPSSGTRPKYLKKVGPKTLKAER